MVTLEIVDINCYYGSIKALENITFKVREGEFVGILGPNGSGKTTLLRTISRTLKPKVGAVLLDNVNVYDLSVRDAAKNIAVVPQETTFTFDFTALDVVLMGRHPYINRFGMEGREDLAIAEKAMELTNTWHLADRPMNELSGGEKQLVLIARALTQEPKVLLLDEPTTHLDINHQIEIMDLLKEICKAKALVVLAVFHDFNLAARYCDSAILLNRGKIYSIGSMDAVLTAENIRKVFRINAVVKRHPLTNQLYVVPLSTLKQNIDLGRNITIHIICGGGTGASLMKELLEHGYFVTAGVLNTLDTDHDAACTLNVPVVSEAPFSPITEENYRANLEMMLSASAIVVASVPFGYGNLLNLKAAKEALERGIPTFVIDETPIKQRDFTKGEAEKLLSELKREGAVFVGSQSELFSLLENLTGKLIKKVQ
ncbi:MAG: ABC transporter ATP-binding protein [Nitrososphaerota archaeon]|nr:ABC transporter ATP-binding protein [Candidatus Bathyarchaeota archaeon]MDW8022532.1 ABC transporter ATP-binding protein [Nitrososphaerota archaeon]